MTALLHTVSESSAIAQGSFSLYIHIPFCAHVCPYCDFTTVATAERNFERFVEQLLRELELRSDLLTSPIETLYVGGGTPSLLDEQSLSNLFKGISNRLDLSCVQEVTLEANPCDLSLSKLHHLKELGVTRLSIGVQSLLDERLRFLGRNHSAAQAHEALGNISTVFSKRFSVDLMCGLQNESTADILSEVEALFQYNPAHVSLYTLTIERGTPFFKLDVSGALNLPDDDRVRANFLAARKKLLEVDIHQYEVSNFCSEGRHSIHNSRYWQMKPYVGLGPGAHSFFRTSDGAVVREANLGSISRYGGAVEEANIPRAWSEQLTASQQMLEYLYLSLRQVRGLFADDFEKRFGTAPEEVFPKLRETQGVQFEDCAGRERWYLLAEDLLLLDGLVSEVVS